MKFSKEIKAWINKQRAATGKKNGVVRWLFEGDLERRVSTSKKAKKNG